MAPTSYPGNDRRKHTENDVDIALLQNDLRQMRRDIDDQRAKITSLEKERDKALIWGIGTLGTAMVAVVVWIGNFFASHIK